MAKFTKQLSKVSIGGKYQVLVRVSLSRTNRPRFRSGILVDPKYFQDGEIVLPARTKLNIEEYKEALHEKQLLDEYCAKVESIILAAYGKIPNLSKSWIETVLDFDQRGMISKPEGTITFEGIKKAFQKQLRNVYFGGDEENNPMPILSYIDRYCQEKDLSIGRFRKFNSLKRIIFRFCLFEQMIEGRKSFEFDLDLMTSTDLIEFKTYILNEGKLYEKFQPIYNIINREMEKKIPKQSNSGKKSGQNDKSLNFAIDLLKALKCVVLWLHARDLVSNNPFIGFEIGAARFVRRPVYLTIDERNMLAQFDFGDNLTLAAQRDIFIFQCMTGCRYGDLSSLTSANVLDGVLEYVPSKTKKNRMPAQPRIPLTQYCLNLIRKYEGIDSKGRLFPFLSISNYNESLKQLFKVAGLNRTVWVYTACKDIEESKPLYEVASSHMARRTFVGTTYKLTKDPNIISAMSGHTIGSRAFARYRDIDDDDLREVIGKIEL